MGPTERRQKLLEVLNLRRQDTYGNLATEFNVSKRTIRYDIEALICSYPIETVSGRYGGVKMMDGFYLSYHSADRKTLSPKQIELLRKLSTQLSGEDLDTLNSILIQFAP